MNGIPTWLLVALGVLVGLAVVVLLIPHPTPPAPTPKTNAPEIMQVQFPAEITADGNSVAGHVRFRDLDGDVVQAEFEVVEALVFTPFAFDPGVQGVTDGTFEFSVFTVIPQEVALRVTLIDAQGHRSQPMEFRFTASEPQDTQ